MVIRLARGFGTIAVDADGIIAGAAALDVTVAEHAAAAGLTGLEFLSGIPGSIGGAVVMNGGAYGGDIASCLDWAEIVTRSGEQRRLSAADLAFAYRHSRLPHGAVVVRARLRARRGEPAAIAARMAEIRAAREASQPVRARTGGSTFRNPPDMKAWELIDAAGCRGLTRGGAQVSEKHCNFLINTGTATAADLEGLGEEVRRRVLRRDRRHAGMGNPPHRRPRRPGESRRRWHDPCRGTVAVISAEREVSLSTGVQVIPALREAGFEVDRRSRWAKTLPPSSPRSTPRPDAVFNALHGRFGEDGAIQGVLDWLAIPYTHSGVRASALAMDKVAAKAVFAAAGLPIARGRVVPTDELEAADPLPLPYVVKPVNEGSSVGVRDHPRAATTAAPRSRAPGASAPPRWSRNTSPAANSPSA